MTLYRLGVVVLSYVILVKERASGDVSPGYLGCYKDDKNEVRLTGFQSTFRALTALECNLLCFNKAFLYAATKNGKECYCGDLEGALPKPDEESNCDVTCVSDITSKCGGKKAFSFYSTGIKEDDIDNLEELEIGCLRDSDDQRLIGEHKIDLLLTNTPKRCIAYCRALGYPHAGVQYSLECYCGMARKTYPLVEGCDKQCAGDNTYLCGGDWKAMVYSTGITKPSLGISSRGCFQFNKTAILTKKSIPQMTSNKCVAHCYAQGHTYAHIHNGFDCLCGKTIPLSRYRVNSAKCDNCPGDKKSQCGSEDHMSTYTTGVIGDPTLGKLLGCFKDENNDLLSGPKLNLGVDNWITLCISRCIELGFAYAGLRNTFECQCSQSSPKRTPVKIVPDYECSSPCALHSTQTCGAQLFLALHRTGLAPITQEECVTSVSRVSGKNVCGGQLLFSDDFDTMDVSKWEHVVEISGDDEEFVTYTSKKKNISVKDGKLIIQPTIVPDKVVRYGQLDLKGCTGVRNSRSCKSEAKSYNILPPVESGQVCTRRSLNFRYGIIGLRAKLPKGDWVVPYVYLKPVQEVYGPGYISGKLMVVTARGNEGLVSPEGMEIGAKLVESGFRVAYDPTLTVKSKGQTVTASEPWYNDYHNYSVTWTADTVLFYIDGNILSGLKTIYTYSGRSLLEEMGMEKQTHWNNGTILAPFDQEFYLCMGVAVGGMHNFPDGSVSNGLVKPWKDKEIKSRLKFWQNKQYWKSTWSDDTKFEVDSIRVTAY